VLDRRPPLTQLFLLFLRLGLTNFGGLIAHLGYFRNEFVERRPWLTDQAYADLVALCHFLPVPASSQVVIGIGLSRSCCHCWKRRRSAPAG
jgi:chromate transporter